MTKLPAILEARIAGTGIAVRPCVNTYLTTRPVRVETTTTSTDWQGRRSEHTTWHRETHAHVSRFQSTKVVNTAVAETDTGATIQFDTDDQVMRVGETVYLVGHSAAGRKVVDVLSPRLSQWMAGIHEPGHPNLPKIAAFAAALALYGLGRTLDDMLVAAALCYGATLAADWAHVRIRLHLFSRSRARALQTLRAAGVEI